MARLTGTRSTQRSGAQFHRNEAGSDGDYYKLPLPYGYNFFYNLGDALEAAVNASPRRKKLLGSVLESFITAFSPVALHAANSLGDRLPEWTAYDHHAIFAGAGYKYRLLRRQDHARERWLWRRTL